MACQRRRKLTSSKELRVARVDIVQPSSLTESRRKRRSRVDASQPAISSGVAMCDCGKDTGTITKAALVAKRSACSRSLGGTSWRSETGYQSRKQVQHQ